MFEFYFAYIMISGRTITLQYARHRHGQRYPGKKVIRLFSFHSRSLGAQCGWRGTIAARRDMPHNADLEAVTANVEDSLPAAVLAVLHQGHALDPLEQICLKTAESPEHRTWWRNIERREWPPMPRT
jgi:hypothetical protein